VLLHNNNRRCIPLIDTAEAAVKIYDKHKKIVVTESQLKRQWKGQNKVKTSYSSPVEKTGDDTFQQNFQVAIISEEDPVIDIYEFQYQWSETENPNAIVGLIGTKKLTLNTQICGEEIDLKLTEFQPHYPDHSNAVIDGTQIKLVKEGGKIRGQIKNIPVFMVVLRNSTEDEI